MRRFVVMTTLVLAGCGGKAGPVEIGASAPVAEASLPAVVPVVAPVVASAPVAPVAEREPLPPVGTWSYDEKKDEMRGKSRYLATLYSQNEIQLAFPYNGGSSMRLTLRDDPEYGKDVMLVIDKGQLPCYAYDGCSFKVKFDDGPVQTVSAAGAENGSQDVLFVSGPAGRKRVMNGLRKAKRMVVEVQVYDAGRQQFVFEPAGLHWSRF
ncbi:hypothetical protein [Vogesella oryzae]|uniref:hypothetical protein n=1 Tax=Vogesella oryzae TaxID=1735285 RepID=UPI0015814217|nr:hypothetical protein [Vogesella oryzae]